jgi:rare lipoprotein A
MISRLVALTRSPVRPPVRSLAPSLALSLALAACAGGHRVSDWPVKIGQPYSVRGVSYAPAAAPGYEAVGYASWYGSGSGDRTANGERYRARWVSGAHTTLPLPSYVAVTALESGRTILVRVNDRGPFAPGRVIDLSQGAARLLGVGRAGQAAVHVRLVDPPERDRARLRRGKPAAPRPDAAPKDLATWRSLLTAR